MKKNNKKNTLINILGEKGDEVFNKQSGVQGNWIRIQPEHEASFIPQPDSLIQVGVILGAGSKSIYKNNIGDKVVVRDWMVERPTVYEETRFYTTDENVLDIL